MPHAEPVMTALEPRAHRLTRDAAMILIWTAAVAIVFWNAVTLKGALFYFDITEINYPYRAFFAAELKAGRFSTWFPDLYCGMPLYSESQAGYLHPLKYLFYPWLPAWQAFNLDTVVSVWIAGLGVYGWLRTRMGPLGALTGAAVFGMSGFMWGHLIHTSMINALASVPFVIWGLESAWRSGRGRGLVVAAVAIACQVFAGHLQDALFSIALVGLYAAFRAWQTPSLRARLRILAQAGIVLLLGVLLSAVQWVPSKKLLDRSPRADGLSWEDLTFASWNPELLPTLVLREAYGTRARDTDWMDGYYPYHEMNTYLGMITIVLMCAGAARRGERDRDREFWVFLLGLAALLMLGRYTFLFDYANRIPIAGGSREPVRFFVWVTLAAAVLAGRGVERVAHPGEVSFRRGLLLVLGIVAVSVPIMLVIYAPVWTEPRRWTQTYHLLRYRWLGRELEMGIVRVALLSGLAWWGACRARASSSATARFRWAALLPILILIDLASAHWNDAPTVDPAYWTRPPASAVMLRNDPDLVRIFGIGDKSAGEPGYASEPVDFMPVRDPLDWSLPPVWGVPSAKGNTPMIARRLIAYFDHAVHGGGRHDIESVTHIVTGKKARSSFPGLGSKHVGEAFIHKNPRALPRVRLVGRPVYTANEAQSIAAVDRLTRVDGMRERIIVEDPAHPLDPDAKVEGSARIREASADRVVVEVEARAPGYLFLADTFDPGWTATVDGVPAPIRPAYVAFRAVFVEQGNHTVLFRYRPEGIELGLMLTALGLPGAIGVCFLRLRAGQDEGALRVPPRWLGRVFLAVLVAVVLVSIPGPGPGGRPTIQSRWKSSFHTFTWGAGYAAMKANRM